MSAALAAHSCRDSLGFGGSLHLTDVPVEPSRAPARSHVADRKTGRGARRLRRNDNSAAQGPRVQLGSSVEGRHIWLVKTLVSWSGGKDACMALHRLREVGSDVVGLLTTLVTEPDRVGVHEVGAELVRRQAAALGLPLAEAAMPAGASNAQYERALAQGLADSLAQGVEAVAFGDLFLADIRAYRDGLCERLGVSPLYPVWGEPTEDFARAVIGSGFRAVVCSVDARKLPLSLAGRPFDEAFLADLPPGADPCGENGEFHTFVYDGPGFARPVGFRKAAPELRGWLGCCPLSPS